MHGYHCAVSPRTIKRPSNVMGTPVPLHIHCSRSAAPAATAWMCRCGSLVLPELPTTPSRALTSTWAPTSTATLRRCKWASTTSYAPQRRITWFPATSASLAFETPGATSSHTNPWPPQPEPRPSSSGQANTHHVHSGERCNTPELHTAPMSPKTRPHQKQRREPPMRHRADGDQRVLHPAHPNIGCSGRPLPRPATGAKLCPIDGVRFWPSQWHGRAARAAHQWATLLGETSRSSRAGPAWQQAGSVRIVSAHTPLLR